MSQPNKQKRQIGDKKQLVRSSNEAQNTSVLQLEMIYYSVTSCTYSAFLVALREHDDGACTRFPDHPPEGCHCAGQRPLGGYELIGTQITLEKQRWFSEHLSSMKLLLQ